MAREGGDADLDVCVRRKSRRVVGNESVASQDAAQEIQIWHTAYSVRADSRSNLNMVCASATVKRYYCIICRKVALGNPSGKYLFDA